MKKGKQYLRSDPTLVENFHIEVATGPKISLSRDARTGSMSSENRTRTSKDDAVGCSPLAFSPVETHNCDTSGVSWLTRDAIDTKFLRCLAPRRKNTPRLQRADNVTVPKSAKPIVQGANHTWTLKLSTNLHNHLLKHEVCDPTEILLKIRLH